ncbi:MAG: hypothetical protein H6631_09940 [Anaerolineaceae bacterium]|nr:hypothetical protein [Anaerolineaceae bacterium]MCB9098486.1 hypothetical protein [Anaerolineales bacterium]
MPRSRGWVAVLWGANFDEKAAAIFVTELRAAGLWVKLVGLSPLHISGSHGLVLVPDFTLDQALAAAQDVIGVIIPYASPGIKRLKNDPRLRLFCEQAARNEAKFIVDRILSDPLAEIGLFYTAVEKLILYPSSETLVEFARQAAGMLRG